MHIQLCPALCDLMDCSLSDFPVCGISQARISECVAISSSKGAPKSKNWNHISCISCTGRQIPYHWATWEACTRQHCSDSIIILSLLCSESVTDPTDHSLTSYLQTYLTYSLCLGTFSCLLLGLFKPAPALRAQLKHPFFLESALFLIPQANEIYYSFEPP